MEPTFPILSFGYSTKELCFFVETAKEFSRCSLSIYYKLQQEPEVFFDAAGRKFRRELQLKHSFGKWQKLLSYVYWTSIPVENRRYTIGNYTLEELKSRIKACIEADDDILTQFIDADHLISLIKNSRHFEDIYMVLQGAIYSCEDDDSIET